MQDLNDKITGGTLTAVEWNEVPSEIQNVIEELGQTLTSSDLNQLGKSIAGYVSNGNFYTDSGIADAYVLTKIGSKQTSTAYTNGFLISFISGNDGTGGATTVNVAGLGVKDIKLGGGSNPIAGDVSGRVEMVFDSANDWFELLAPKVTGRVIYAKTTSEMANNKFAVVGNVFNVAEHSTGNGGKGVWNTVLTSSVTPNTHNVIVGVFNALISFVLKTNTKLLNANSFGATVSGDNASAVTAAQDVLTDGGKIFFEPNASPYPISVVDITNAGITVDLSNGANLIKSGSGGASARGIFRIQNFLDARFTLIMGGDIDLNGEGPLDITVAGKIANTYANVNPIGGNNVQAITGPLNAAIYALRSSRITVQKRGTIKNTGESAILFRNCAHITVDKAVQFKNIANWGVEFNVPDPSVDGGTGDLPDPIGYWDVNHCHFEDIDDYGLGGGNGVGVGVGGGGLPANTVFPYVYFDHNTFNRVNRDIHIEFNANGRVAPGTVSRNQSRYARQGSIAAIGARQFDITHNVAFNPGSGAYGGLNALNHGLSSEDDYVSIYGIAITGDIDRTKIESNIIVDNRGEQVTVLADGAMTSGSKTFTSALSSFTSADINKWIGLENGAASATALVAYITEVNSGTSVELSAFCGNTVSGANFTFGSALRRGIDVNGVVAADFDNNTIDAGIQSAALTNEPAAKAVYIQNPSDLVTFNGNRGTAPTGGGATPSGLAMSASISGEVQYGKNRFVGYTENYENIDATRASMLVPTSSEKLGTAVSPDATPSTPGTPENYLPHGDYWDLISNCAVTFLDVNLETVIATVTFSRFDGEVKTETLTLASPGGLAPDEDQEFGTVKLAELHTDRSPIRAISIALESDKASSTARARLSYVGIEG